jgi:hypothetical protein
MKGSVLLFPLHWDFINNLSVPASQEAGHRESAADLFINEFEILCCPQFVVKNISLWVTRRNSKSIINENEMSNAHPPLNDWARWVRIGEGDTNHFPQLHFIMKWLVLSIEWRPEKVINMWRSVCWIGQENDVRSSSLGAIRKPLDNFDVFYFCGRYPMCFLWVSKSECFWTVTPTMSMSEPVN